MLVLSDTNILSSLAAGNGFHLDIILQAIDSDDLQVLELSHKEKRIAQTLPKKLNEANDTLPSDGECEAIALAQNRKGRLLSNDKRAVRDSKKRELKS